ncbi:NADPH dehydrogenase NamA [Radiobacillus kanasensis]|uniref:NADPH dehydrogenase NamA n=1 Tax=Radiobacillus kanasensis TaxID=2844358 RepID=UPI001E4C8106|nr:NADPH dehydrogenase NamA [Radiobacillus kanasensis]UFT97701.1 NADPH dehydrogenase NamA [Radiobacillus kanasensis]
MTAKLFSSITYKDVTLKNRIVMAPMCMYSCEPEDGTVQPFHLTHYETRAIGQAGLVMLEATAVQPEGRISSFDLGIWDDQQLEGLTRVNERIHAHDAKSAIQLAHAGRKSQVQGDIFAPSAIAFNEKYQTPKEMTKENIQATVQAFKDAAVRSKIAGFDIIEIHGAHGYLINQFLSPLTNQRTDEYGGNRDNRFRLLREVVEVVQTVWNGPLFVRLSANEYNPNGNHIEDFVYFSTRLKELGVDLVDCSSGGVIPAPVNDYPGYQVPLADTIKQQARIDTGAVGMITTGIQAEEILQNNRADLIFIARALLRNPYWPKQAADELHVELDPPKPYARGWI